MELIQRCLQQVEESRGGRTKRHGLVHQGRGVGCGGAGAPIGSKGGTPFHRAAFFQHVQLSLFAGVEQDFAGIKQIDLSEQGTPLPLAALGQGGQLAMMPGQPDHDLRCVSKWPEPQGDGLVLENHGRSTSRTSSGMVSSHAVSRRRMAWRRAGVSSRRPDK